METQVSIENLRTEELKKWEAKEIEVSTQVKESYFTEETNG